MEIARIVIVFVLGMVLGGILVDRFIEWSARHLLRDPKYLRDTEDAIRRDRAKRRGAS